MNLILFSGVIAKVLICILNLNQCKAHMKNRRQFKTSTFKNSNLLHSYSNKNADLRLSIDLLSQLPDTYTSEYLHSLTLSNWGVFKNETLNLKSSSSFIVITGKSGSGKSVLLSAFEHLIKSSTGSSNNGGPTSSREIFSQFNDKNKGFNNQAILTIQKGINDIEYKRIFNLDNKKSACYINNKKSTIKAFTPELPIRFWFRDSLKYLGSGEKGVINYIDSMLVKNETFNNEIKASFHELKKVRKEIKKLEKLNNEKFSTSSSNSAQSMHISMLRHFVLEIDTLKSQLLLLFDKILNILEILEGFTSDNINNNLYCNIRKHTNSDTEVNNKNLIFKDLLLSVKSIIDSYNNGYNNDNQDTISSLEEYATDKSNNDVNDDDDDEEEENENNNKINNHDNQHKYDLSFSFSILLKCDKLFNELSQSYNQLLLSSSSSAVSSMAPLKNSKSIHANSNGKLNTDLSTVAIIKNLDKYLYSLELFQSNCYNQLGIDIHIKHNYTNLSVSNKNTLNDCIKNHSNSQNKSLSIFEYIDAAIISLSQAKQYISDAQESLINFESNWPYGELSNILQEISKFHSIFDSLCRKHNTVPRGLDSKTRNWKLEIMQYDQIDMLLPLKYQYEKKVFSQYCQLASQVTFQRVTKAQKLIKFINQLLPNLEMKDKQIFIEHQFNLFNTLLPQTISNSNINDNNQAKQKYHSIINIEDFTINNQELTTDHIEKYMSHQYNQYTNKDSSIIYDNNDNEENIEFNDELENGWDDFSLKILHSYNSNNNIKDSLNNINNSNMEDEFNVNLNQNINKPKHASVVSNNKVEDINLLSIDTLSSGEKSRLALALETCCLDNSSVNINMNAKSLIVYDELDAHVSGDAAVAIARLLKKQGCYRQLLVVTHNPVIAAAADVHYIVDKYENIIINHNIYNTKDEKISYSNSNSNMGSVILEVKRENRVEELARMSTGNLGIPNSLELARALLQYDFTNF